MMKKLLVLLLVLAVVCSMAFVFTACNDGTGDQGDQGDQDDVGGGSGSVGGDEGDGDTGDQGGDDGEGFNQEFKDSDVSVAGPEDDAAKGDKNDQYTEVGK